LCDAGHKRRETELRIRKATAADLSDVLRLYQQLSPEDPVLTDGKDQSVFQSILDTSGLSVFLLESDGNVVSTCYLNIIPNLTRSACPYAIIENVVTDKAVRGEGFGRAVLQHAMAVAWESGCYKVMLLTGSKTEATHAFYRSCGFSADEKTGYIARSA
jgi:N-acetylglutamate synthase-like GNAT family acetyltransferase